VDGDTFRLWLHEHYADSAQEISDADECASHLSDFDTVRNTEIAVLGTTHALLFALPVGVHRSQLALKAPEYFRFRRKLLDNKELCRAYDTVALTEVLPYRECIFPNTGAGDIVKFQDTEQAPKSRTGLFSLTGLGGCDETDIEEHNDPIYDSDIEGA
jgi:hypothetical protein